MVGLGIELTAYAPALAAILTVALFRERRGIRRLLRPVLRWRVGVQWFLVAAFGSTLLFAATDAVHALLHAPVSSPWFQFPTFASIAFLIGALLWLARSARRLGGVASVRRGFSLASGR